MEEKLKLGEKDVKKFDFTTFELNYIIKNANFNKDQLEVFKRLTDIDGRQTIIKMSMEMDKSTATISRIIDDIKNKIYRLL